MDPLKNLVIAVEAPEQEHARLIAAFADPPPPFEGARYSFTTDEDLWRTLNGHRWAILKAMCGEGPMSIRHLARLVERDSKVVHGDAQLLLGCGLLRRHGRRIVFPHETVELRVCIAGGGAPVLAPRKPGRPRGRVAERRTGTG